MKKKLSIFMIIFVLFNVFSILIVNADYDPSYDYKQNNRYKLYSPNYKYEMNLKYYSEYYDTTYALVPMFKTLPTLYYDSELELFYFHCEEGILNASYNGSNGSSYNSGWKYLYIDSLSSTKKFEFSENLLNDVKFNNINNAFNFTVGSYEKKTDLVVDFTPIFDESCPSWAREEWGRLLSDDAYNGYQDNVTIDVQPSITSSPTRSWTIPKEYLKDDVAKLVNYDVSDYFFTVTVSNKGAEPFEFILTANSEKYNERGSYYQHMKDSADDLLNTFQVDGNPLIRVEGNSTFTYNFNFSEIDHDTSIPTAFGGLSTLTYHQIFLNFWTQESYRIAFDGLPVWQMPEIDPETGLPIVDENDIDEDGKRIFGRSQAYRCAYSHDFSFYGSWRSKVEKQENYKDVINQLPIADLITGNEFTSVDFNLNPDIGDFKSMINSSKDFLELIKTVMVNFMPQFMWIIIAMGLTSIVILRILGR